MSSHRRKRWAIWLGSSYLALWLLTATVGTRAADAAFDREFARGSVGLGSRAEFAAVKRLPFRRVRTASDFSPELQQPPWRMRTRGIAIAPFLIVDEAAWLTHALSGFARRRLVVWAFGYCEWHPLKEYWVS